MATYGGPPRPDRPDYDAPSDPWGDPAEWDGGQHAGGAGYDNAGYPNPGYPNPGYPNPAYNDQAYGGTQYRGAEYAGTEYAGTEYAGTEYATAGYGAPGYGRTAYGGMEYPGVPDPDPAPPERSSTRLIATIVGVLAVLLIAGGVTAFVVTRQDNGEPAAQSTPSAGPAGEAAAGGEPTAAAEPTGTPAPESSAEARFATVGQCLVNQGTDAKPSMRIVACGPNTYQVLARFDGTTDYAGKCAKVKGYAYHYYFDAELNSLDFVLCLKKR